ncbi:DUF6607 family protein [Povalibacter sp.]|uniref:DUF6607 family protein n=1 Tax=Povalibacter sp. TaxID=1962978 RepID=UPI002F42D3F0
MKMLSLGAILCVLAGATALGADAYAGKSAGAAPRYTFSWPLDGTALQPRGGTTKGAPITLDLEPSPQWIQLQAPGLSPFEKDRRAILAMAGTYRVTFDFLEVVPFATLDKPNAPYQSWGTEKVYVDSDDGKSISLVHILEMRVVMQDGSISEPMVTKHWRQDWQYEPDFIVEHRGRDRWERHATTKGEIGGAWSQTVYQVDESPRYASIGRWEHSASFSSWLSCQTWRPLPRREWSVRDDYQVLIGTNRHTIGATGWVQEENNLKAVLTAERALDPAKPYVAREYGVARYERIRGADFSGADRYFNKTKAFWDEVRDTWATIFAKQGSATLRGPVDKLGLFQPLFARADEIEAGEGGDAGDNQKVIRDALTAMGALR